MFDKVLHFSGGKDSLACLYLLRSEWEDILVLWGNAGNPYPETLKYMEEWKRILPNFLEVRGNQPVNLKVNGYPSDVVPSFYTEFGRQVSGSKGIKIQSTLNCCAANLWAPVEQTTRLLGAKVVVRGQRNEEKLKSTLRDGDCVDGIVYRFPVQDWSEQEVLDYLKQIDAFLPPGYYQEQKSRDCWDCTGYLSERAVQIRNLPHWEREVVINRLRKIQVAISLENHIPDILEANKDV